ncbi:MAG: polysaccharide export protein [Bacteroidia bacterium]|nr:polysaccharide export protein [Bacteroidia bacterium]
MSPNILFLFSLILAGVTSCIPQKKLIYFQGKMPALDEAGKFRLKIFPGDILSINIFTIQTEAYPYLAAPMDKPLSDNRSAYERGFVVNEEGCIQLPLVGVVKLSGLTISESVQLLEEKFRKYIDDPIVTLKKLNFKVTVLGEVNKPGTYPILNEKATLPEVLGLAGDLTQFANRTNLRIIRDENNQRKDFTVDLTKASSLSSETYYLHPDDIIYVEPVRQRAFQAAGPGVTLFTSMITTAVVVITLIVTLNK